MTRGSGSADLVYPAVVAFARAVFRCQGLRFSLLGTDNVPRRGGAVMVINHIGYLDFAYAGLAARPSGRLVRFMAKQEVFDHRLSGPLMRGMHHIPVDRDAGSTSFRAALRALRDGEIVGVFPEATISRSFELKQFKPGAIRMAAAARVPLLPTVVWGSQRVWTKDQPRRLGRTHTPITVCVGEAIEVPPRQDPAEAAADLRLRMSALLHDVQRSYPGSSDVGADGWWLPARLGGGAPTPEQAARRDEREREERVRRRRLRTPGN